MPVDVTQVAVPHRRSVEVCVVGPADGRPVLYFHSPATAGEELRGAVSAAARQSLRLISLRRPSVQCDEPRKFVETVAEAAVDVADELGIDRPSVLAWSGGAPYALCTACFLGDRVESVHLVSPIPGPLTGPDAVPEQTQRLREVARSSATSSWISGPSTLRDYQAVAAPWPLGGCSTVRDVTIWSPTEDEIVPPHLLHALAKGLPNATVVEVSGTHTWLIENWTTVLERI